METQVFRTLVMKMFAAVVAAALGVPAAFAQDPLPS